MKKNQRFFTPPDTRRVESLAGLPLASFTRRTIALLIDFVAAALTFVLLVVVILLFQRWTGLTILKAEVDVEFRFFENWYSVLWLVVYFTLSMYLGKGRTLGKRLCGIRIVSIVHDRLSLWHAFERAIGYGASTLEFGFGFFQFFIREDRRTIHDRIAETIVILEPRSG